LLILFFFDLILSKIQNFSSMKKFTQLLVTAVLILITRFLAVSQVNVTATAGTTGPTTYTTLKLAFDAINAGTHQGDIVIGISASTTETAPAVLNSTGAGSAIYTSVLIQPTVDGVTISGPTTAGRGLIELNGADNVTINGDNPNSSGTNRNLTISNTAANTVTYTSVIRLATTSSTVVPTCDNFTLRNSIILGNATARLSGTSTTGTENTVFGFLVAGKAGTTATTAPSAITSVSNAANAMVTGTTSNNILIDNCSFNSCARGIAMLGFSAASCNNFTVTNNQIGSTVSPTPATPPYTAPTSTVYTKGVIVQGVTSLAVTGNTFQSILTNVGTSTNAIELVSLVGATGGSIVISNNTITGVHNYGGSAVNAILFSSSSVPFTISGNIISNIQTTGISNATGINISSSAVSGTISNNKISTIYARNTGGYASRGILISSGSNFLISNNLLWDLLASNNNSNTSTIYAVKGIALAGGTGHRVYHNTVSLSGSLFGTNTAADNTACLMISGTGITGVDVRNNIFSNTISAATAVVNACLQLPSGASSTMNLTLNNNAYYTGTASNHYTAILQATFSSYLASNFSANSVSPALNFRSYTSTLSASGNNDNASFASTNAAPFISATDLHIDLINAGLAPLYQTGASGTGVTNDFDNDVRATSPCIGADEFTLPACSGTPAFASATISQNSACGSGTFAMTTSPQTLASGYTYQWQSSSNNVTFNNITNATGQNFSALVNSTTYYQCILTCTASGQTASSTVLTATINPLPTITITPANNGYFCGGAGQTLTASGALTYAWSPSASLDAATGTTVTSSVSTPTTYTVTGTDVNGCINTQQITVGPPSISITSSVVNFCGTGGNTTLTATSVVDPALSYTWTVLTPSATLSTTNGSTTIATLTETSDFKVTANGSGSFTGCVSEKFISVGVYPLPTAAVTTTASGVCPGTSATIGSGLSAGNFSSLSINHLPLTAPANAIKLVDAGTALVTRDLGTDLDDGGWSGVPVGFNFNFFGTNYSTISVGTNGTVFFGALPNVTDFTFGTLPSTTEPFNMVAVLAMDNNLTGATGGTIKYWTTGYAPNRKFIVSYENVKEFGDTKFSTAQAIFYETIGVIEVHVTSSTNQDRNKLVGVNNGDGTIGVLAYASGTASSATNPIASPFAYRFTPPANYTTTWSATDINGTTQLATGTNIFSQTVTPAITTDYAISYTNQTTGCTNAPGSAQVNMVIYSDVAPLGVNTIASSTSFCDGQSVNFNLDYTGTTNGIVYQWQVSTVSGVWSDVASATSDIYSLTPTQNASYRCKITACNGTPSFSSEVTVNYSNEITSTTPATRCGVGTAIISAVGSAGTTIAWYASATATTPLGTGSPFTTSTISATTTYFVAAETFAGTCSSARVPVTVTVTDAPVVTLTNNQAPFCGTGGTATITATTSANYGFTWSLSNPNSTISNQTATSIDVTVSQSTSVNLTAVEVGTGCVSISTISVSVYPLPTANVTSDVNGVCPGTAANINTGLSAGNFTSTSIPHAPLTAPGNAVTLATGGAELVPTDLGFGLDDGGWSGIPVGFNFNFFGTSYNTISIGTNGTVFFGATPNVGDFTFSTLPSTTEPFNMVAVLAMDNDLGDVTGGTIKYWTEGTAPNRKFIVSYENVQEYFATETSTAQAIFYETVGEIDVHVTSSTNVDRNKLVGVNNGDGTVGVLAFASGTVASPTNPITNPFAYRFAPPANYTTVWTSTNTQGTTTIASGTNIFTQAVIPTETTVYSISYTNQTTGCTNAPGSADVTITILGNVAPVGVNTVSSVTNVCEGVNFQISANYTGSSQGLTYQWQFSTDNGANFTDIAGQTSLTLSTSQNDTTIYRLAIVSCGGTPSYSSQLTMNMSAPTDCYCVPTYTFGTTDGDLISNVEIVGTTLANNTGFVAGGPSYTFFNGQPNYTATLLPSSSYTLNISTGEYGSQGYAAWIDYNDDGIFDATELIGATNGTIGTGNTPGQVNASSSFVIALACTPPAGVHRMRIRGAFFQDGQSIQPCTNYGYGETEDYLITIAPAPTCPSPGLLIGGTTTTTSADVNWSLGCSTASAFDFEYGPVGFTQGTGTLVSNVSATTSTTLSGLIPNSSYQVYYRANCGNGDVSAWSVPVTVSTLCAPITLVNPGAQVVCNTYTLPTLAEVTPSNNAGLVLSYRTATNGGGTVLTGNITTTQTVHIYGVAGACSANQSFLVAVNNGSTSTTNITQCITYTWTNNVTYTTSGTHTQTLANAVGCDSVATLNLIITQPTTSTLNEVACQTFTLNNQTYTASGTYVQTLINVAGCDSTLTLNLTIGQPDAVSVTEVACDSYTWNGSAYTTSGVYIDTLTNAAGCDSVVTLNLTINNTSSSNTVVSECASYTWNGTTYTASGSYTFTAQNAAGCDSTATLVLTIGNNSSTTTAATCGSFTWTNGTTYTASGTYTQTLTNAVGCDSLVTLNLTINQTPTATATDNGNGTGTLVASTGASYQWIDCATNTPITGATSATYTAPINGSYAVIVTNSTNCSATSSCVIVDYIGLEENTVSFNVYPNPTTGAINIVIDQTTANYDVTVEDMNGRAIANFGSLINGNGVYSLDLSNVVTGVYFIKLRNELEERTVRIIKQ